MINTSRLLKVVAAWVSIVWVICYVGVAVIPGIRPAFMMYGLHARFNGMQDVLTFGTFISGLVIWNVVAFIGAWLFATLFNSIKK